MYSKDFDTKKLKYSFRCYQIQYRESQNLNKLIVTKVITIVDILSKVPAPRGLFSEIDKCVCVYLNIPFTTCTAERSFLFYIGLKLTYGTL